MSLTRKVAHNTIYQVAARVFGTGISLIVAGLSIGYLGDDGYGRYTIIFAFVQLFAMLADLGLYVIMVKRISEPGADTHRLIGNFFSLRLFSAIIFLLILAPVIGFLIPQYPAQVKLGIVIMAVSFLFVTLIQLLTGVFQKELQSHKLALAEIVGKAVLLITTMVVVFLRMDFLFLVGALVISQGISFFILLLFSRKYFTLRLYFDFDIWKSILRDIIPIALAITFNLIYFKADTVILGFFRPEADVGIYGAPYRILEAVITIPSIFVGLVLPLLAGSYAARNMEKFRGVYQKAWDFLFMMALPLIFGTWVTAPHIIRLLTRDRFNEFLPSVNLLQILILAVGCIFLGTLFGHLVVAVDKQKDMLWNYFFVAITSLAGYLVFIPRFGYFGAAWMTVYSEGIIVLLGMRLVYKATHFFPSFKKVGKIFLASILMGLILFFLKDLPLLALIVLGVVSYSFFLYIFKAIDKNDLSEVLAMRKKDDIPLNV